MLTHDLRKLEDERMTAAARLPLRSRSAASTSGRADGALVRSLVLEPGGDLVRDEWAGEVVALDEVAAELPQLVEDLSRLDALGDDVEPEVVAQVDDRAQDRAVVR